MTDSCLPPGCARLDPGYYAPDREDYCICDEAPEDCRCRERLESRAEDEAYDSRYDDDPEDEEDWTCESPS